MTPPTPEAGLSSTQIAAMLTARRRLVAWITVLTVVVTAAVLAVMPRTWTAWSDVYIDYKAADPIAGRLFSAGQDESYLQTQVGILTSQAVTERVIENLGLRRTADYQAAVAKVGEERAFANLSRTISTNTVVSKGTSRVIGVSYSSNSPTQARDFANEVVRSYMALSAQIGSGAARSRSEQYNAQLEKLRSEANRIQDEMTAYQQKVGIVNVNEKDDVVSAELGSLTTALVNLQSQRQEASARQQTAESMLRGTRPEELPEIASLPVIADLKSKLSDTDRRLSEARSVLGPNHPRIRALMVERGELQGRLASESRAAIASRRMDVNRLETQERDTKRAIEVRQARLLAQKQQRDRIMAYQRELEGAERVYNAATQKYDELLMAGNISAVNLTVLREAEAPTVPTKPRVLTSLAASVVVGLVLGLCLALLLELGNRRLRSRDDLVRGFSLPLLGQVGTQ